MILYICNIVAFTEIMKAPVVIQKHKLRRTATRERVLEILMESRQAMSESEILQRMGCRCDRTTIYRTLNTFRKENLVHRIIVDDQNKYSYREEGLHDSHHAPHAHFKCNSCGKVSCMKKVPVTKISLPRGYVSKEVSLLIMGTCKSCNHK